MAVVQRLHSWCLLVFLPWLVKESNSERARAGLLERKSIEGIDFALIAFKILDEMLIQWHYVICSHRGGEDQGNQNPTYTHSTSLIHLYSHHLLGTLIGVRYCFLMFYLPSILHPLLPPQQPHPQTQPPRQQQRPRPTNNDNQPTNSKPPPAQKSSGTNSRSHACLTVYNIRKQSRVWPIRKAQRFSDAIGYHHNWDREKTEPWDSEEQVFASFLCCKMNGTWRTWGDLWKWIQYREFILVKLCQKWMA